MENNVQSSDLLGVGQSLPPPNDLHDVRPTCELTLPTNSCPVTSSSTFSDESHDLANQLDHLLLQTPAPPSLIQSESKPSNVISPSSAQNDISPVPQTIAVQPVRPPHGGATVAVVEDAILFADEPEGPLTFPDDVEPNSDANQSVHTQQANKAAQTPATPLPEYPRVPYNIDSDVKQGILRSCEKQIQGDFYYGRAHGLYMVIDKSTAYYNASIYFATENELNNLMDRVEMKVQFDYIRDRLGREPFYRVVGQHNKTLNGVYMHGLTMANVAGYGLMLQSPKKMAKRLCFLENTAASE